MPAILASILNVVASLKGGFRVGTVSGTANHEYTKEVAYAAVPVAGQVDVEVSTELLVTTGTPQVIDLTAVRDAGGVLVALGHLTHWLVTNESTTAGQDVSYGGGSNPVLPADTIVLPPTGGMRMGVHPTGVVVDGTHKNFQVTVAAGTNIKVRVTLWGRTT